MLAPEFAVWNFSSRLSAPQVVARSWRTLSSKGPGRGAVDVAAAAAAVAPPSLTAGGSSGCLSADRGKAPSARRILNRIFGLFYLILGSGFPLPTKHKG